MTDHQPSGTDLANGFGTAEFRHIEKLIQSEPEAAWHELVAFVASGRYDLASQSLLEDFVSMNAGDYISRIEDEANSNLDFAKAVAAAHVGDSSGTGVDAFVALQSRVRDRLGIAYVSGWIPLTDQTEAGG